MNSRSRSSVRDDREMTLPDPSGSSMDVGPNLQSEMDPNSTAEAPQISNNSASPVFYDLNLLPPSLSKIRTNPLFARKDKTCSPANYDTGDSNQLSSPLRRVVVVNDSAGEIAAISTPSKDQLKVKSDRQGDALYDMKIKLNATGNQLADWNQNQVNPCTWNSIICDSNNNVVQVTLSSMGFSGILSPRIGELQYLTVLSLPGNNITGGIPEQFGNLSSLTNLELENNHLNGTIPASLGKLSKLQILILSQNNLSGNIPESLTNLGALNDIRLAFNDLSGQIPEELFQVARYNFSGNNLNCGTNYQHPCASITPAQGKSQNSKVGIVLGTVGGVSLLLVIVVVFLLCKGQRKGYRREEFVDVAG
ncbi:putative LRR receptor-like serine/threonine-protein kinase [Canna indica]|uniref:LRR receptor-like serine/threonine-protein kinase n=1 Tax=Canna indica TaxID=4628 RepID=A0AAQ3L3H3_9LILI|nr:putative LRR receptor-like serine/threonine-protein kinase [Canna indica]